MEMMTNTLEEFLLVGGHATNVCLEVQSFIKQALCWKLQLVSRNESLLLVMNLYLLRLDFFY